MIFYFINIHVTYAIIDAQDNRLRDDVSIYIWIDSINNRR